MSTFNHFSTCYVRLCFTYVVFVIYKSTNNCGRGRKVKECIKKIAVCWPVCNVTLSQI
jgi:hypothetical protein